MTSVVSDAGEVAETSGYWFREENSPDWMITMRLKSLGKEVQSDFQHVRVIETAPFGKTLVLDHKTQSSQHDEHVYHETLVHPTMLAHPNPKRVYIGGGGEMATAREVLRHKSVEQCVMVDIDKVVVDFARTELQHDVVGVKTEIIGKDIAVVARRALDDDVGEQRADLVDRAAAADQPRAVGGHQRDIGDREPGHLRQAVEAHYGRKFTLKHVEEAMRAEGWKERDE